MFGNSKGQQVSDNQKQIEQLLRQHDHDRWTCSLFAPDTARPAILALLAFNHEIAKIREIAHESAVGHIRLAWWREAIDDLSRGIVRQHFVLEELAKIPSLDYAALQTMIDARGREFEDAINPTHHDFINYCRDTSGVLWGLCCNCHLESPKGGERSTDISLTSGDPSHSLGMTKWESAINIGTAWAMIGILRSVLFQAQFRRMYLPLDLLVQNGIDKDRFFDVPTRVDLSPVVKHIAEQAQQMMRHNVNHDNPRFINALSGLGFVYLQKLRRAEFNLLNQNLQKPLLFKLLRLWLTMAH